MTLLIKMTFFKSLFLLLLVSEECFLIVSGQECKKKMTIKHKYTGKALIGHTFMTKHANDAGYCQALCFMHMEKGCISVTFDSQKMLCNLSDSDQIMHPEHLVDASNAIFWSTENTCNCTSKNMSCGYSVTLGDYHCYCKLGYGGHNCETDLKLVALYPMNARYQARSVQADAPDGVISNVNCIVDPSSPLGSCEFKGLNTSYIEIPNKENGKLDVKGSMTLLAFIRAESPGPIFHYGANIWGVHWWVVHNLDMFIRMMPRDMSVNAISTTTPIPNGQWKYVGMTYNISDGVNSLWMEGKRVASKSIPMKKMVTQFEVRIGVRNNDIRYFKGKIACMQAYKQALNELQIKEARHHCDKYV